ncbi:hypothetical protein [Limnoglobus roseus]|nr:hypothetical protein [Limnoglobus roseus]
MREIDDEQRMAKFAQVILATVPPTLTLVVTVFVLSQTAPTVQFNLGSSRAMNLWSFWVHWWPNIFGCSVLQVGGYLFWSVGSLATRTSLAVRLMVGFGLLTATLGSFLLSTAFPDA